MFALCVGFAAPLSRLLNGEGGGFHFYGNSSTRKTTLLQAAGSIWGGGESGFIRSWRTTDNALEGLATLHNDMLLALDEIGQCTPKALEQAAYSIANGQGKARLSKDALLKTAMTWQVMLLSSGELTLQEALSREGIAVKTGQELRLVNLPADAEKGKGIWETVNHPAEFSNQILKSSSAVYGTGGPDFVRYLMSDLSAVKQQAGNHIERFESRALNKDSPGQIRRTARRFAIVAAAGQLANIALGLGWKKEVIENAAATLFKVWKAESEIATSSEVMQCLRAIIDGWSRFPGKFPPISSSLLSTANEVLGHSEVDELLLTSAGLSELTGLNAKRAAKSLKSLGVLNISKEAGRLQFKKRNGNKSFWYYSIKLDAANQILNGLQTSGNSGNTGNR